MASEIRANKQTNRVGLGTVTYTDTGIIVSGIVTANSFKGDGSSLTGIDLGAVTGATSDFSIADKIVHTGDTNTAIRFPAVDTITAETSGSERLRITSDGKVGVNNNNPAYTLDVYGDNGFGISALSNSTAAQLSVVGKNSAGNVSAISRIKSHPSGSGNTSDMAFETRNSSSAMVERLRIKSTGSVGINSTTPANVLDVEGEAHTKIHVGTIGTGHATGIQINHAKGNAALQQWQLQTDASADGNLVIRNATSGTSTIFFDADNNYVGINDTSPPWPLSIRGAVSGGTVSGGAGVFIGIQDNYAAIQMNTASDAHGCIIDMGYSGADYKGRIEYINGDDYMRFFTNGSERLHIRSGGQVNIGGDYTQTTYPFSVLGSTGGNTQINIVQRLKYSGDSNQYNTGTVIAFTNTNTNANAYSYIGARIDNGSSGANANALVFATNATNTAPTEKVRITSAGYLGIGTAAPQVQTHIFGADAELLIERGGYSEAELWLGFPSGQPFIASGPGKGLKLGGNGKWNEGLHIKSDGNIVHSSTTAFQIAKGTTAERPGSPVDGMIRFNSTLSQTEEYRDSGWFGLSNKSTVSGGTVTTSGSYTIHTFTSSGTFTVSGQAKTGVDYLLVAGGAGGGSTRAGAGGAGGMTETTGASIPVGTYTITVGAGGAGAVTNGNGNADGAAGSTTSFGSLSSVVGGGYGGGQGRVGGAGGSGGGGSDGQNGGAGTSGQGNAGGNSISDRGGGGGGGKGGAGNVGASSLVGGAGGAAGASNYSGSTVNYSGGGGGGSRDNGAGGNGGGGGAGAGGQSGSNLAGNASANQGGGGGGGARYHGASGASYNGGNGGSGIVIIRYLT